VFRKFPISHLSRHICASHFLYEVAHQNMPLLALPSEIHLHILRLLDYKAFSFLRATNAYFYRLPSRDHIMAAMTSYECEESLPDYYSARDFYPCYICLRMLPEGAFDKKQIRFTRAFGHKEYRKRFCFECGLRSQWGVSATEPIILPDGSQYRMCHKCYHGQRKEECRSRSNKTYLEELCATCKFLYAMGHLN
jgi:hypothetical protein